MWHFKLKVIQDQIWKIRKEKTPEKGDTKTEKAVQKHI